MAAIVLANPNDRKANIVREIDSRPEVAGEALTALDPVRYNAQGRLVRATADTAPNGAALGVVTKTVAAGEAVTLLIQGDIEGADLSGRAYGDTIYLGDTGGLDSAAGTVSVVVGRVVTGHSQLLGQTPDKILRVRF